MVRCSRRKCWPRRLEGYGSAPSSFIRRNSFGARIAGDFDISTAPDHADSFEFERVRHQFDAFSTDGARSFSSADDLWRNEEGDLVYQTGVDKLARDRSAAFDQNTLQRTTAELLQDRIKIAA